MWRNLHNFPHIDVGKEGCADVGSLGSLIKQRKQRRVRGWPEESSTRVTGRTQATGRGVCLATINQDRLG